MTLVLMFGVSDLSALAADESDYVAEFRIATDKVSAQKDEEVKVSVLLKTNYYICAASLVVIYDSVSLQLQNTSEINVASFLTFEGSMADTYRTNGNWTNTEKLFNSRNSNTAYWSQEDVMNKYKAVYATWSADTSLSSKLVMLSEEEEILSFSVKALEDIEDLSELVFISLDFRKTSSAQQGTLFVGRSTTEEYSITNMVNVGQTVIYNGTDPTKQETVSALKITGTVQSFGAETGKVTLKLSEAGGENASVVTVTGNESEYVFENITSGTYTLEISKENHVTRAYEIIVNDENVTCDAKIHLMGDINGDGKVNTLDVARANANARGGTALLGYEFACSDTTGDGKVNTIDVARINAHAKGVTMLW